MTSSLFPLPLLFRKTADGISIGEQRAFWHGGAQVARWGMRSATPGALALKMEAQPWNCNMEIFHPFRPPVGPGGGAEYHSNFHAPEGYRRSKGVTPVNGGPGPTPPVRGEMSRSDRGGRGRRRLGAPERCSSEPSPWRLFGSFLGVQKGTRPVGRNPCKTSACPPRIPRSSYLYI